MATAGIRGNGSSGCTPNVNGSFMGNALQEVLAAQDIQPGDQPGYSLCKLLYLYHPLGQKMAESPVKKALSQSREITVPVAGPQDRIVDAFLKTWAELGGKDVGADELIFQVACFARVYGISTLCLVSKGTPSDRPLDFRALSKVEIAFNMYDPLNTSGSLALNQATDSMDFMRIRNISINGKSFHPSRFCVLMNERPVYISYTSSAFGFVGRSVYQRALYPLKSFLQTMLTDDLVTVKAGVLIAKITQAGSIISNMMVRMTGFKRELLKEASTGNVLSIGPDDDISSLNFQNLDAPYKLVRENILKNIATAADMPAVLLENETLTEGFGEGVEDSKTIADYIDGIRKWLAPVYAWLDEIVMYLAWTEEFYATLQRDFPELAGVPYVKAFYDWKNSFHAQWPSLLKEPPSEKIKVDKTKLESVVAMLTALLPSMDPDNKAVLIEWAADNFNDLKVLFPNPLVLDYEALAEYVPPTPMAAGAEGGDEGEKPQKAFGNPVGSGEKEGSGLGAGEGPAKADAAIDFLKRMPRNARK